MFAGARPRQPRRGRQLARRQVAQDDDTFPPYGQITTGVLCKSSPWPVWATA